MWIDNDSSSRRGSVLLALVACCVVALAALATIYLRPFDQADSLPGLGELPPFEFTSQEGEPFTSQDLDGRIWISNFMFTSCPSVCPMLSQRMSLIAGRLQGAGDVHLLSFSVDPEDDTPAVLKAYAEAYGADPAQWSFLTGEQAELEKAIEGGFKVSMGGPIDRRDLNSVMHGTRFVLGDKEGNIRGYFDVETDDGIDVLMEAVDSLRDERP